MLARPRRSVLYMPGSNAKALAKARTLPADALILDLEDSVALDQKVAAREQVVAAVRAGGFGGREVVIRVNGPHTPWEKRISPLLAPPRRTPFSCPRSMAPGRSWSRPGRCAKPRRQGQGRPG